MTRDIRERISGPVGRVMAAALIVYLILGGGFMLRQVSSMVSFRLLTFGRPWQAGILFLAAALLGTGRKIQRRARLAEAAFPPVIIGFTVLLAACVFQVETFDWSAFAAPTWRGVLKGAYYMFCAFSIVGVLPFFMHRVQRPQGSLPYLYGATGTANAACGDLSWRGAAAVRRRGNRKQTVSADFSDGIGKYSWGFFGSFRCAVDGFLLFALLYSVGTVLFYSQHLISKNPGVWHGILAAAAMVSGCICPVAGENGGRFLSLVCAGVFYAVVRPFWTLFW